MKITRRAFMAQTSVALAVKAEAAGTAAESQSSALAAESAERTRFEVLLERNDPTWEVIADKWSQGLPLGNGDLGVMIWGSGNPLCFTLDKTDIWEKRHWTPDPERFKWREFRKLIEAGTVSEGEKAFQRPPGAPYPTRLPVGRGELRAVGKVKSATMRLDLWTATGSGEIITEGGALRWQAFVHATKPLIILEIESSGTEANAHFSSISFNDPTRGGKEVNATLGAWGYPPPESGKIQQANYWSQAMPPGGQYAVAWRELAATTHKRVILGGSSGLNDQGGVRGVEGRLARRAVSARTVTNATGRTSCPWAAGT